MLPQFMEFRALHLLGTYWAIVLPAVALPVAVFVFHSFIKAIPDRPDRGGPARRGQLVADLLPGGHAAVPSGRSSAVAILTFITSWNAFLWPLLVLTPDQVADHPGGAQRPDRRLRHPVRRDDGLRRARHPARCSRCSCSSSVRSPRASRTPASSEPLHRKSGGKRQVHAAWVQGLSATPLMMEVGSGVLEIDSVAGLGVGRCRVDGRGGGVGPRRAGQDGVSMVARLRWVKPSKTLRSPSYRRFSIQQRRRSTPGWSALSPSARSRSRSAGRRRR